MESSSKDYYEVLCVTQDASRGDINRAYQILVEFYHPTYTKLDPVVAYEQMLEVSEAYAILANPASREAYDLARRPRTQLHVDGLPRVEDTYHLFNESITPPWTVRRHSVRPKPAGRYNWSKAAAIILGSILVLLVFKAIKQL